MVRVICADKIKSQQEQITCSHEDGRYNRAEINRTEGVYLKHAVDDDDDDDDDDDWDDDDWDDDGGDDDDWDNDEDDGEILLPKLIPGYVDLRIRTSGHS
ncbi:hypothetical protein T265_04948 [Opisthorchis viverrini]|uniref:Uncharacterized protein n=1 Tax=Opisthorchis viverrini TaxID=6198 RepID=A0A074ZY24_OPIVI|nr:hypothetical protein T265_04948 [Opisthorchis viverrini]KER28195.1 hypothetical protein T265_04948 [Opisthorchis viverrini]